MPSLNAYVDNAQLADYDWELRGTDTDELTHGYTNYPATMPPEMVRQLLNYLEDHTTTITPGDTVLDPFCGSGTTAVEARRAGYSTIATDINPFAALLTQVKATPCSEETLRDLTKKFWTTQLRTRVEFAVGAPGSFYRTDQMTGIQSVSWDHEPARNPDDDGWFPDDQYQALRAAARHLEMEADDLSQHQERIVRLAISRAAREVSYQRESEHKRYRLSESDRATHNPDAITSLDRAYRSLCSDILSFSESVPNDGQTTTVLRGDTRSLPLQENVADAAVFSPPYGDHKTTVGYGEFSRIPLLTGFERQATNYTAAVDDVDPVAPGGRKAEQFDSQVSQPLFDQSPTAKAVSTELRSRTDNARVAGVQQFLKGYTQTLTAVCRAVKPDSPIMAVVGPRTVAEFPIPLHTITEEVLESTGASLVETTPRSIPTKRMPWENSPSNVVGETGETIAEEYLVHASTT